MLQFIPPKKFLLAAIALGNSRTLSVRICTTRVRLACHLMTLPVQVIFQVAPPNYF